MTNETSTSAAREAIPDDYVGHLLVGWERGSRHVIWVNTRSGSRAAAYPPDGILNPERWTSVETMLTRSEADAELAPLVARIAELEAERARLLAAKQSLSEGAASDVLAAEADAAQARADLAALRQAVEALADDMDERGKPGADDSEADSLSRRQIREDVKRLRAALAAAGPAVSDGRLTFEQLLADPHEQFDKDGEVAALWLNTDGTTTPVKDIPTGTLAAVSDGRTVIVHDEAREAANDLRAALHHACVACRTGAEAPHDRRCPTRLPAVSDGEGATSEAVSNITDAEFEEQRRLAAEQAGLSRIGVTADGRGIYGAARSVDEYRIARDRSEGRPASPVVAPSATDEATPNLHRHNHLTRDIKPLGKCPACDEYHRHAATDEGGA